MRAKFIPEQERYQMIISRGEEDIIVLAQYSSLRRILRMLTAIRIPVEEKAMFTELSSRKRKTKHYVYSYRGTEATVDITAQ